MNGLGRILKNWWPAGAKIKMMEDLSKKVCERLFSPSTGSGMILDEKVRGTLLEQYKVYVEMADRVSARRQSANTFSLSINTALIALVGYAQAHDSAILKGGFFWTIAAAGCILNFVWYRMVRSYKDLNTAKFLVIHEIEKRLVITPFDAEWEAVGRGKDPSRYLPFSHIEIMIPWVFFAIHWILSLIHISEPTRPY